MKKVLSNVFLGALLTIGSAVTAAGIDADAVVGTWKLNLAKSTFGGGPALKSQIRTYSRSARGITLKMETVSADGLHLQGYALRRLRIGTNLAFQCRTATES